MKSNSTGNRYTNIALLISVSVLIVQVATTSSGIFTGKGKDYMLE